MSRSAIAFLVAPLWVPVVVTPVAAVFLFPHGVQAGWVVVAFSTLISAVFTYFGVAALGLPAFLILRSCRLTKLWIAAVLGFAVGAVTWIIFIVCLSLFFGEGIAGPPNAPLFSRAVDLASLLPPSLLGLLVGVTFWLIARPDRTASTPV